MKHYFLLISAILLIAVISCKDDEDDALVYEYHAHIHQPDSTDRQLGDTLEIEVEFESHTGQPVHHININIFKKADNTEVYSKPDEAHVHATSGAYTFEDEVVLSGANGFSEGDWVLEATVWGEEDGQELTTERVEFHINL